MKKFIVDYCQTKGESFIESETFETREKAMLHIAHLLSTKPIPYSIELIEIQETRWINGIPQK